MVRHFALGNQSLLINIDKWLQVRDIFFPQVGQYNHLSSHAHKIAVLEHNDVSWLNSNEWERSLAYQKDCLVTKNKAVNKERQLEMNLEEGIGKENIFLRKMTVKNKADRKRKLRIAFHQDFHLFGDGVGDTALYHPEKQAIIHYKRDVYFLLGIMDAKGKPAMSSFDCAEHPHPSFQLPENAIAQGNVDSLLCIDLDIPAKTSKTFTYYLIAGKDFEEVFALQGIIKSPERMLQATCKSHKDWLSKIPKIGKLDKSWQELYKRSLLLIRTQIDKEGAILAGNDSDNMMYNKDTYSYLWPRDGALVAIALIKAGYPEFARKFFLFCKQILHKDGYFLHKYNPDKTIGSSWHPYVLHGEYSLPIQEDGTALVLHALEIYHQKTGDDAFIKEHYDDFIKPMGDFLASYRYENGLPKESYDLWEERRAIFTFTTATVLAGLRAALTFGDLKQDKKFCITCEKEAAKIRKAMFEHLFNEREGYYRRSVSFEKGRIQNDEAMDSSVYGLFAFGAFAPDDPHVVSTMERMKDWLWVKTHVGGFARYYNDYYHQVSKDIKNIPGNPWFISTLWYAKWLIAVAKKKADLKEAKRLIDWAVLHALPTGVLAEQLDPHSGEPMSISPLTWSHAEFVDTCNDYLAKEKALTK